MCVCVSEKSEMAGEFQIVDANERDDSQDDAYWAQYRQHVVSADRQQVWDALLYTFNKYLCVLPATHAAATTAATRNGPCFKFSLLLSLARWQQRHLGYTPPFPFHSLFFPLPPFPSFFPVTKIQPGSLGSAVSSPSGVQGVNPARKLHVGANHGCAGL